MRQVNPSFNYLLKNPLAMLGFGFGSGLSPWVPGTMGTLAAVPFYIALSYLPLPVYLVVIAVTFFIGVPICGITATKLGVHDHGGIVWDEFVGFWITMIAAPSGWPWVLLGFVLFRFFDMIKPWPISWVDRYVKGGWGIMLDDVVAAIFAAALMHTIYWGYLRFI